MNNKKARKIRKEMQKQGLYNTKPKYREITTKKMQYDTHPITNKPFSYETTSVMLVNENKIYYRRAKMDAI